MPVRWGYQPGGWLLSAQLCDTVRCLWVGAACPAVFLDRKSGATQAASVKQKIVWYFYTKHNKIVLLTAVRYICTWRCQHNCWLRNSLNLGVLETGHSSKSTLKFLPFAFVAGYHENWLGRSAWAKELRLDHGAILTFLAWGGGGLQEFNYLSQNCSRIIIDYSNFSQVFHQLSACGPVKSKLKRTNQTSKQHPLKTPSKPALSTVR